ncbi:MAG: hypothetical protein R3C56_35485 [Pirellulaceae bacterium]
MSHTPCQYYGCDGSKAFGIIDQTGPQTDGPSRRFSLLQFLGTSMGLASSQWIAEATGRPWASNVRQLTLCYLPHLDYDFQRLPVRIHARG